MNTGDKTKLQSAMGGTLKLALAVWKRHNLDEARQIAEILISMQLGQIDLKEPQSRKHLLTISKLLCDNGAADAVMDICLGLRQQQENATPQDQIIMASLLNRVCLMVGPVVVSTKDLAA